VRLKRALNRGGGISRGEIVARQGKTFHSGRKFKLDSGPNNLVPTTGDC